LPIALRGAKSRCAGQGPLVRIQAGSPILKGAWRAARS
jgi:hypothetical protein